MHYFTYCLSVQLLIAEKNQKGPCGFYSLLCALKLQGIAVNGAYYVTQSALCRPIGYAK